MIFQRPKPSIPTLRAVRVAQRLERVVAIYARNLLGSPEALAYLARRGFDNPSQLAAHRAGYANGRLHEILPATGAVRDELTFLGVLSASGHESFAGCVVFPVTDVDGNLVTLYGRRVSEAGPRRHVLLPAAGGGLWNAPVLKTYPEIIVVESVFDALSVEAAGFPNVVAPLGDPGRQAGQMAEMQRYGVERLLRVVAEDREEAAGDGAMIPRGGRPYPAPETGTPPIRVALRILPAGYGPNRFHMAYGKAKLAQRLQAGPLATTTESARTDPVRLEADKSFTVSCGTRQYRLLGLEKGARTLKVTVRVEHAGRLHVDTLDLYSARPRRTLSQDLCRLFDETPEIIAADITKLVRRCEALRVEAEAEAAAAPVLTAKEMDEATAFGQRPDLFEAILADFETCGLVGEEANKLLGYLAAVSRKMPEPLSVLILSSPGAGKTALQDAACGFVPPEDRVKLTRLSGKALFYKQRTSLKHKVLALEEEAGAEDAGYAIRNLISAGELIVEAAMKDPATGRMSTMTNHVEGPTAVLMTTTNPEIDPETKSRFILTSADESREQTRAIQSFQRRREGPDGLFAGRAAENTLKRHHNFQRLLRPLPVVNPLHETLRYADDRLQGRRDQPKYLALIRAVAFLRQMQKEVKHVDLRDKNAEPALRSLGEGGFIEVDAEDLRLANRLAHEILGHSLDELSRPSRNLLMELEKMVKHSANPDTDRGHAPAAGSTDPHRSFTRRQIRECTGWSNYRVHVHLKELVEFEYVSVETDRVNNTYRYRLLYDGQGKDGSRFMPGLADFEPRNPQSKINHDVGVVLGRFSPGFRAVSGGPPEGLTP